MASRKVRLPVGAAVGTGQKLLIVADARSNKLLGKTAEKMQMPVDSWRKYYRFIDAVGVVATERHFRRSLQTLAHGLGFELYAYINIRSKSGFAISNYPKEWQDRYFRKLYQRVDPVIESAGRKMAPFEWSLGDRQFQQGKRRLFSNEAHEFGIRSGVTIPIPAGYGHKAMLTFASGRSTADAHSRLDPLPAITVASLAHAYVTVRRSRPSVTSVIRLAPQEAICLRWAAEGKSMHEAAALLDIKYSSARSYLDKAREKLGAVTLIQAVATATRLNLI
ncbi:autoinducer binding domain-containing protein [Rhizobium sp. PL01]|uniref:autoinducer binding domain-containing protein n=1 Tax=Rhizobium sp. PL01 TaxID=3085631 RepID=UPI0029822952|nr:autoinducer binding domain-containing protein [Rhizobium sp. PL01]MDW5318325.1 autoinducer binding domain-containing protein [Rhizobium sp. PL01]